ncbi:glycerol dehydratase reactivase beta/small subunit family protein [Mycolicibacterium sediminis]|uniref:PduH protein n=1 Tax=Mycolicibacterium sediminis TaxID=1286180 RepID=A0A7I7QW17_9MYCO|nr:glycerol dehydratase reactivase beta/small subunit family protein [Mycolicibacterium sediminis]BBY30435.1 hypothetical protein MSEDJ_45310 [Mycolicibacterium sediminis]
MSRDKGPTRPVIVVASVAAGPIEDAVLAGIEEEGVPFVVDRDVDRAEGADAAALARVAALRSPLGVGVGIDAAQGICVQPEKVADPMADLMSPPGAGAETARVLGHDAARICVGLPLKGAGRRGT